MTEDDSHQERLAQGKSLLAMRRDLRMSQMMAAALMGVTTWEVVRWEAGDLSPTPGQWAEIGRVYAVPLRKPEHSAIFESLKAIRKAMRVPTYASQTRSGA